MMSKYSYKELRNLMPLITGGEKFPFGVVSTLEVIRMQIDTVLWINSGNLEKQIALVSCVQWPRQRCFTGCRLHRAPADTH